VVDFSRTGVAAIGNTFATYGVQEVAVRKKWNGGMMECRNDGETVKTVGLSVVGSPTPLKRGVNESDWLIFE